jgi:signal transduction histidine kinase
MDDLSAHGLSSEGRLHLMRIVQESITNVIKHAQASVLSISTTVESNQHVRLHIQDNGCGFSGSGEGHGMDNMRSRIEAIGGILDVLSNESGTSLSFKFESSI